jgi:hypothetical protein
MAALSAELRRRFCDHVNNLTGTVIIGLVANQLANIAEKKKKNTSAKRKKIVNWPPAKQRSTPYYGPNYATSTSGIANRHASHLLSYSRESGRLCNGSSANSSQSCARCTSRKTNPWTCSTITLAESAKLHTVPQGAGMGRSAT